MKRYIFILLAFILIFSIFIFSKNSEKFEISYYVWENSYKNEILNEKLYIKVLDIDYSSKLEIIKTNFIETPPKNFIPTIYITNKTMQNVNFKELSNSIIKVLKSFKFSFDELQIDCDWSDSSKTNFFLFLEELKKELDITLSATLRLHQIKYFYRTGVPPVDYGILMYYNMSNLSDFNTKNYILDNNIAKKYLYNFDVYPLKLKLALPLYSQAIQFRNKRAINLFEGIKKEDFNENFEDLGDNRFQVLKSHYFKGQYIYKNDILRFDYVTYKDLEIALNDFLKYSKNYFNEIIFYTYKYKNSYNLPKLLNIKGEL
ncbi:hypothetical protein [Aliarcobacter skirrowii]|uniref:hypothetical protein n=1 Tax=Aliarcobacter skirrowii TaxID=28200 RepID=UPI0029BA2B9B|nr:hypothetical protein [Aliarcobacter skirrowii]MDX4034998.1 hypothetical protein [Aliarcobacter skirrowii]